MGHLSGWWWSVLISMLFLTTFGFYWCVTLAVALITFLIGLISLLYINKGNVDTFYRNCGGNPLSQTIISDGGLQQVVKQTLSPKKQQKTDNRVTGSELIDSSLQEILVYIIRDYVSPWYNMISIDDEFPQKSIRKTAQRLAINISNRVKEVDWIPYLTTRLVDDAASHLRLFKQARAKMKLEEKPRSPRNSPRRDLKVSPKRVHKRNKSETDIAWYLGRNINERREVQVERNVGTSSKFYAGESSAQRSFEDHFFDLECTMENNVICRDLICTDSDKEKEFLSELVELLLYILLPDEDFECKSLRFILREIFSNCVILPLITMVSDPDYINQAIIWLCLREMSLPNDIFLSTLRLTDNCDELKHTKELVSKEIQLLRSRDSGGESDLSIKQQLSSLCYVIKIIDNRLAKMDNCDNLLSYGEYELTSLDNIKSIDLPLHFILKNNVALSYFIDYASSLSKQSYLYFYLNIEGWKVSVEQQLSDIHINKLKGISENPSGVYENIRSTAMNIYEQYLGDKGEYKVDINPSLIHKLFFRIRNLNEPPSEQWFDDVQRAIYEKMQVQDEFLPSFKKSKSYVKLLEELDLVQQNIVEDDAISLSSFENLEVVNYDDAAKNSNNCQSVNGTAALQKQMDLLVIDNFEKTTKHVRSLSDVTYLATKTDPLSQEPVQTVQALEKSESTTSEDTIDERELRSGDFVLCVKIIETGIVCEKGKTFGIYATQVSRQYDSGFLEEWHIYRRYSDFHDLHTKIKDRYQGLGKIAFPGKKTFHNMDRAVLERRMKMLGAYMQEVCQPHIIKAHPGLRELLMTFLEQGEYDRATLGGPISNTIDTIVNPIKSGMKSIKNMPEQIIHTVDEVVEKVFHPKTPYKHQEASKVGASLDIESDDNIPLRIMLLLVDEVFDLKSRNQWLRRRIVTILRQIVRTMFGDIVNRRILEYVSFITSPKNVAHYLHTFKQSFWPNGMKAEKKPERDDGAKYRTRVAAKIALLSCLTDELKHIIGSETTRKGLLSVFELFQRPILNRRLLYVLFEGILGNLFPEKNVSDIFQKLHSKSKRYQDKQKELFLKTRKRTSARIKSESGSPFHGD